MNKTLSGSYVNSYTNGRHGRHFGGIDLDGKPVERTKRDHPYAYDSFVQERVGPNSEINGMCYSDRLLEWDYTLTRNLIAKHFADTGIDRGGDYWHARPLKAIEGFLRERLNNPSLRLIVVMEGCNVGNGYPLWSFHYNTTSAKATDATSA